MTSIPLSILKNNEADAETSNTETRGTITKKGHIDHQIKEVRKQHHQKYKHSKIAIPEKNVIPTTSETEIDTKASSSSNPSSVITLNSKLQIHKWSGNTILITGDSMISGIDEKRLSKKYPVKVPPFPGASDDDMYHLRPLLEKCPEPIILHVGTNNCVNESSGVVLDKTLNLKTFIQNSLPQSKVINSNVINRTNDGKTSLTVEN